LLIAGVSYYIFHRTKELYQLSKRDGVFFFRNIFLFFSIAYIIRAIVVSIQLLSDFTQMVFDIKLLFLSTFFFTYVSLVLLGYLAVVILFAKSNYKRVIVNSTVHWAALFVSSITFLFHSYFLLLVLEFILLVVLSGVILSKKTHMSFSKVNYMLLILVWILNTGILVRLFSLPLPYRSLVYLVTIGVFCVLLIRIEKRLVYVKKAG